MSMIRTSPTDSRPFGCWRLIRRIRAARVAVFVSMSLLVSASALAGTETLRWYHPSPGEVTGFKIVQGSSSQSYDVTEDIGLISAVNDVYTATVVVPDAIGTFVAVVAYNADGDSVPSNERFFAATSVEPDPSPEPDPSLDDATRLFPLDANMLYGTNFAPPATGDWFDTGANNSLARDDSLFVISAVSGTNAFVTTDTSTNIHSHIVSGDSAAWTDYEVRGRMLMTQSSGGLGVTTFSDYPNSDMYYRLRSAPGINNEFRLTVHPQDIASLVCTSDSTGVTPSTNTWYVFRIRTTNGATSTIIEAKVWPSTGSEPSAWQARCEDVRVSRATGGTVGVWSMGGGTKAWDDLEVILADSGSSTPPSPSEPPEPPVLIEITPAQ